MTVEDKALLDKLVTLSIVGWDDSQTLSRTAENGEVEDYVVATRHISPDANEFNSMFGLGTEGLDGIAPLDVASVALLGVQDLQSELQARDATIQAQAEQIVDLQTRLAAIEAMLLGEGEIPPPTK